MAKANAASRVFVCATPQNSDLELADFEMLTWVEIKGIGSFGETGNNTNVLTYDTWSEDVIQKAKGQTDAGSPELELARIPTDPGQIILKAAAAIGNNNNYAFKMLRSDAEGTGQPTTFYNRGIVLGPRRPNGRNEDFDLLMFTLGLQQAEVEDPAGVSGVAPVFTVAPAYTGAGATTPTVGEDIVVGNGTVTGDATITYTYQWFANGVALEGATSATLTLATAHVGKYLQARVRAANNTGHAIAFGPLTAIVAAA